MKEKGWVIEDSAGWSVDVAPLKKFFGDAFCLRVAAMKFGVRGDRPKPTQLSHTEGIIHFLTWTGEHANRVPGGSVSRIVSRLRNGKDPVEVTEWIEVIRCYLSDLETGTTPLLQTRALQIWNCLTRLGLVAGPVHWAPVATSSYWMRRR